MWLSGGERKKKKAGKKGINELSQIKPCSYCTLETCYHGGRKGREEEKKNRLLEVKERKSGKLSHTLKPVTTAIHNFVAEKRFVYNSLCSSQKHFSDFFIS